MRIVDWNPSEGFAFQGDVSIIPIPADILLSTHDEIKPIDGRLIIQEGELTGHHHAIRLPTPAAQERHFRDDSRVIGDPAVMTRSPKLRKALGGTTHTGPMLARAHLYRDAGVTNEMARRGILTRTDLAMATLVVEGGPVTVSHEEHDGIRVPVGRYLVGRQIESAGADERIVAD